MPAPQVFSLVARFLVVIILLGFAGYGVLSIDPSFVTEPSSTKIDFIYQSTNQVQQTLYCLIQHIQPGQSVSWIKNNQTISEDYTILIDNPRYSIVGTSNSGQFDLLITQIDTTTAAFDTGQYQCILWNGDSIVLRSRLVDFDVRVIPPVLKPTCSLHYNGTSTANVLIHNVEEGDSHGFLLTCTLPAIGVPWPTIEWYQNTVPQAILSKGEPTLTGSNLIMRYRWTPNITDNEAYFLCRARYPTWSSGYTCSVGPFNVLYKPKVELYPELITLTGEGFVTLVCTASANPNDLTFRWVHDNEYIDVANSKFVIENTTTIVIAVGSRDNGDHVVTCEVSNTIGVTSASSTLVVNIPVSTITASPESDAITETIVSMQPNKNISLCSDACQSSKQVSPKGAIAVSTITSYFGGFVTAIIIGLVMVRHNYIKLNLKRSVTADRQKPNNDTEFNVAECTDSISYEDVDVAIEMNKPNCEQSPYQSLEGRKTDIYTSLNT